MSPRPMAVSLSLAQVVGLIVVVVLLVFGVTLASLYLPTLWSPKKKPDNQSPTLLTFDDVDTKRVDKVEKGQPGYRTYWFTNPQDKEVAVKLVGKFCQCSTIMVCPQVPAAYATASADELAAQERSNDASFRWYVLDKETLVTIPPGARGGLRMTWDGKQGTGAQVRFWVEVQTECGGVLGEVIRQEAVVEFIPSVVVSPDNNLSEPMRENEKENIVLRANGEHEARFIIWSPVRKHFTLHPPKAALPHPCIVWGDPEPLTAEECEKLSERDGHKVASGYRVTVKVRERSEDGKSQLDLGPFRRQATLTSDDFDPVTLGVSGRVLGEISVVGKNDRGALDVGQVKVDEEKTADILVSSKVEGLALELDPAWLEHRPPYFKEVKLEPMKPTASGQGEKVWKLSVTLYSTKAVGNLPREESVVVLRATRPGGDSPRTLRIPVTGNVYQQ